MSRYVEPNSIIGTRIMAFRMESKLTQADLADRYEISGPAVFKFEKGFVTPSLKLWLKMAEDMDIPEKEAVRMWVKEKLPPKMQKLVREQPPLDPEVLKAELEKLATEPDGCDKLRELIMSHPDITPSLKSFAGEKEMWSILKPSAKEVLFLIKLDRLMPRLTVSQFRDMMVVGRAIQFPED